MVLKENILRKFSNLMKGLVGDGLNDPSFTSPELEERDYYREIEATQQEEDRTKRLRLLTELSHLIENFQNGRLAFIGPAGSGKTTLLKTVAHRIMKKEYLKHIELVFFLQCTTHKEEDSVTAMDVFFKQLSSEMSEEEVECLIDYARDHSDKTIFILDSLDSLQYDVCQSYGEVKFSDRAGPHKHVGNFLAGKYFPRSRIIASSREHSIKEFTKELRPEKVVALVGLSKKSIEEIIKARLLKVQASQLLSILEESPTLAALCSNPGFLFYTMCVMTVDSGPIPTTTSGMLAKVLHCIFFKGESIRYDALTKMRKLSSRGTDRRQHLFSDVELEEVGLTIDEVVNLTIRTPWGQEERLLQGKGSYQFLHASLQEILTALDIVELPPKDFQSMVPLPEASLEPPRKVAKCTTKRINEAHYAFTRRILYGLLLNEENTTLLQSLVLASDLEEKRNLLKQNIMNFLPISSLKCNSADTLEILYCIYEAGSGLKDIFKSSSGRDFRFRNLPLSITDAFVIGSTMSNCENIKIFDFQNCSLKDDALKTLDDCLRGKATQISAFTIHTNPSIGVGGLKAIANICNGCHVNGLCLRACTIFAKEIGILSSSIEQVQNMVLWEDKEADREDILAVISLIPRVTRYLALDLWTISDDFRDVLQRELDLRHPTKLKINTFPSFLLESKSDLKSTSEKKKTGLLNVRNVEVQGKGKDISIEWDALPDSDVHYWIDIFCDGQKIGAMKAPQSSYILESAPSSKKYFFDVWAQYDNLRSESKTRSRSTIKGQDFNTEAAVLELDGCRAIFEEASFSSETRAWMVTSTFDNSMWPTDYIGIAPLCDISPGKIPLREFKLQLKSWCVNLDNTEVEILHFTDPSLKEWVTMQPDSCSQDGVIEFHARHCSPFLAVIKSFFFGKQDHLCDVCLFVTIDHQFRFVVSLQDAGIKNMVKDLCEEVGARLAQRFNRVILKVGDEISLSPKIVLGGEPGMMFSKDMVRIVFDEDFVRKRYMDSVFMLNCQEPVGKMTIQCKIQKNRSDIDNEHNFFYPLAPRSPQQPEYHGGPMFYQTINAHNVIGDQAHASIINTGATTVLGAGQSSQQ